MNIVKVAAYVRVSTQEQAKEGYSVGAQTERLKAYCAARNWALFDIYTDPGYSGAKLERPAIQKLISDAQEGSFDCVLVYKLDRLSRSQKDTLYLIEDVFLKNNVAFVSINENFDTTTAFGRAMIGILSVFAQLEREQIKERTMMGITERAKSGFWHGGGFEPIGYDYFPMDNELRINEYEMMQVKEVFDLYVNKRLSLYKITQHMILQGYKHKTGAWEHASTVRNVLKNNLYIGLIEWNGENYVGNHPAIIEKELFEAAQQRLAVQSVNSRKMPEPGASFFSAQSLLSGIVFCGNCGGRYYGAGAYRGSKKLPNSKRDYIHFYSCYSRTKTKKNMIKDPLCKNKNWRTDILDAHVIEQINKLATDDNYFQSLTKPKAMPSQEKRETLQKRVSVINNQIARLLDIYQLESAPLVQVSERLEALTHEKISLITALDEIKEPVEHNDPCRLREIAKTAGDVMSSGTLEEKRTLIQSLISRITLNDADVDITWNL